MRGSVLVLLLAWPTAALPGLYYLERYAATPGRGADAPPRWPADAPVTRAPDRTTIVMLAHPHCPCTHASMAELARLMAKTGDRAEAFVFFFDPQDGDPFWQTGDLWEMARAIPGVHAIADPQGEMAHRLGAWTSGQVVAYDPSGAWVFSGGLTPARGHEGSTAWAAQLADGAVHGFGAPLGVAPVFGCSLSEVVP